MDLNFCWFCYFLTTLFPIESVSVSDEFHTFYLLVNLPLFAFIGTNGYEPEEVSSFFFMNGALQYGTVNFYKGCRRIEMIWSLRKFVASPKKQFQTFSVQNELLDCYKRIERHAETYLQGRESESYKKEFEKWKTQACKDIPHLMIMRRLLFCTIGFLIEAVTILVSFFFFNWVRLKRMHTITNISLFLVVSLPPWMIAICIFCVLWSHYLWLKVDMTKTFTSDIERHGWIIGQENSVFDHSSRTSSYTSNGRFLKLPNFFVSRFYEDGMPAVMLPMVGLVKDQEESREQNYVIFKNLVTRKQMIVCKVQDGKFKLRYFNRKEVEDISKEEGGNNEFNFCQLNSKLYESAKFI